MAESGAVGRDLIVIGGSAGSIEALQPVIRALPGDLPAAVLVTIHQSQSSPGVLPWVLSRHSALSADYAKDDEEIRHGHVYVAPPDHHLLVQPGRVRLSRGPKENHFRPAVDPLFRTAARAYGPRVIGVVMSGWLNDGTLGALQIIRAGGVCVAQDPQEAVSPDMPLSAIQNARISHVCTVEEMPGALTRLVNEPVTVAAAGTKGAPSLVRPDPSTTGDALTHDTADRGSLALTQGRMPGAPSALTCPQCGGAIWEIDEGPLPQYRCHVGHAYTADGLLTEKDSELEAALWTALRMLQEHAVLQWRMFERAQSTNGGATHLRERAQDAEAKAERLRKLLLGEMAR